MTLETGVKELAEAVGADVKALDAGKVNSNDPRLTDSREWLEDTVTQAEAEAGTASSRRAWTAQRVRQAIAAWYLTVSTTFTRTLLGRSTATQVRGDLGLGTAATRDVGVSSGNVMGVGAFGLGGDMMRPPASTPVGHSNPCGAYYRAGEPGGSFFLDTRHEETVAGFRISNRPYSNDFYLHGALANNTSELRPPVRVLHAGNILTTTGQSTEYPMSQKAVTDALTNAGASASPSANYEYDALGRVDKIVTPDGNTVIGYNPDGTVETISYPTGRVETFTYDMSGNVVSMTATGG